MREIDRLTTQVRILSAFVDSRRTLIDLWGDEYEEKIAPWREVARAVADKHQCDLVMVPTKIDQGMDGFGMVALLAACLDEIAARDEGKE